ncbi:MAG: hypothetical protein AVDCRST_MAG11-832, partial [uncultured Gemmatimonadaceae bacterium]
VQAGRGAKHHDDAPADRTPVPGVRDPVPLAVRGLDQLVRRQTHRLPRARRGHPATALPRPHVQPVRLLRRRARLHRGSRRHADAQGARVERAHAGDHAGGGERVGEVRGRGQGRGVAVHGGPARGRPAAARRLVLRRRGGHRGGALLPAQGRVGVRAVARELRRGAPGRARRAHLPGGRAVAPRRRRAEGDRVAQPRPRRDHRPRLAAVGARRRAPAARLPAGVVRV